MAIKDVSEETEGINVIADGKQNWLILLGMSVFDREETQMTNWAISSGITGGI